MSENFNPYSPPAAKIIIPARDPLKTGTIMSKAWLIFRERFVVIAVTMMLIWIPCELLSSYMDTFIFGEDDLRKSFKFSQLLENFFGIIATAGVIHVALHYSSGTSVSIGQAFASGLRVWPKMWWTGFLTTLVLVLSALLLLVPFFYLLPRLVLVNSVVVSEGLCGSAAMTRSQELTRGRYWQMVGILLLLVAVFAPLLVLLVGLSAFDFVPDHWIADAAQSVVFDILSAYGIVCLFCTYEAFSQHAANASGNDAPAVSP